MTVSGTPVAAVGWLVALIICLPDRAVTIGVPAKTHLILLLGQVATTAVEVVDFVVPPFNWALL